jgi:hypothetical protein
MTSSLLKQQLEYYRARAGEYDQWFLRQGRYDRGSPERFDSFWDMLRRALRPDGRFFLIDSRREPSSTALNHTLPDPTATTVTRKLNDGRVFEICKVFYEPEALSERLARLGWTVDVRQTSSYFLYASGRLAAKYGSAHELPCREDQEHEVGSSAAHDVLRLLPEERPLL